jgi:hypothetical protein
MAVYEITAPDGKVYEVTAPEGASQDQVLSYAKSQFQTAQETPKAESPSVWGGIKSAAKAVHDSPLMLASPLGGGLKVMNKANELLEKGAYNAGGYVTDKATEMGASPETAAGLGFAANVGVQAAPTVLAGPLTKAITGPLLDKPVGTALMQSAMKPSVQDLVSGKAAKAATTMLDEGLNVTPSGMAELQKRITKVGDVVEKTLSMSPATVDKKAVAGRLHDALAKVEKQVTPGADVKVIEKAWQEFLEHPLLVGKDAIPVKLANQIKQGTYKAIGSKNFGELKGAEIEAQKALARGLKEEINTAVPGIEKLNKEQSALLNALHVAERRSMLQGNNNVLGLSLLAENAGAGVGFAADRSSLFKSLLARLVNSGSVPATAAQGLTGLYMSPQGLYPQE